MPTRRERRANLTKTKKKTTTKNLNEFIYDISENQEVGKEIHNDNVKEQEIRSRQEEAELRDKVYAGLFEIYKDHDKVKEIMKKNNEIKYGKTEKNR